MTPEAPNIAIAPRNKLRTTMLRAADYGLRSLKARMGGRSRETKRVIYYPPVADEATLADLANRVAWYLPTSAQPEATVEIPVSSHLREVDVVRLTPPDAQGNYLTDLTGRIRLAGDDEPLLSEADLILVWNKRRLFEPRILGNLAKVEIVDPTYCRSVESQAYARLCRRALKREDAERLREMSRRNYALLLEKIGKRERAYVFCTGPSLSRATEFTFEGGFNVICNSIVKNKELMRHIRPQLLTFADPVFHFSPSKYAAEFRRLMLEAVEEFDLFVMTIEPFLPLLLAHYPQLEDRIIGLPEDNRGLNFPTPERFHIKSAANIMTMLMLPVASAAADEIHIIGADGRQPKENYFWRHDSSAQLDELMETAFATHPSFFRDRIYEDYYEEHCRNLESLLVYGESLGKRYFSMTPSFIPALAGRTARSENLVAREQ
jgi:hypothetical protein